MAWWIPVAMAAASIMKEQAEAKAKKRYNMAQSALTKYSPWTGIQGQLVQNKPNYMGAGLSGAVQGYLLDKAFANEAAAAGAAGAAGAGGGGSSMAQADYAQLGIQAPTTTTPSWEQMQQMYLSPQVSPQIYV